MFNTHLCKRLYTQLRKNADTTFGFSSRKHSKNLTKLVLFLYTVR